MRDGLEFKVPEYFFFYIMFFSAMIMKSRYLLLLFRFHLKKPCSVVKINLSIEPKLT